METLIIHDKKFKLSISSQEIEKIIERIAKELNKDLGAEDVVFLPILNGSFMFASDLLKKIKFHACISFLKLASYNGTQNNDVKELIGINEELTGKVIVVLEDIIDTGNTLNTLLNVIKKEEPKTIKIASLLFKPEKYKYEHKIDYIGIKIPNEFVVGYGLDYNGYGRNLDSIYTVYES